MMFHKKDTMPGPTKSVRPLLLFGLIVLIGTVIAGAISYRVSSSRELTKRTNAMRAEGLPVTPEELAAWYPTVPEEENGWNMLKEVEELLPSGESLAERYPVFWEHYGNERRRPYPTPDFWTSELREELQEFVTEFQPALQVIHHSLDFPTIRFPSELGTVAMPSGDYSSLLIHCGYLLWAEAVQHAHGNRSSKSIHSIVAIAKLSKSVEAEPILLSMAIAMSLRSRCVDAIEHLIHHAQISNEELSELRKRLKDLHEPMLLERIMVSESVSRAAILTSPGLPFSSQLETTDKEREWESLVLQLNLVGVGSHVLITSFDILDEYRIAAQLDYPNRIEAIQTISDRVTTMGLESTLLEMILPDFGGIARFEARSLAKIRCARVALAAEQFRRIRGRMPIAIDELASQFSDGVPVDPFTGKPLRIVQNESQWIVYSVGEDRQDDQAARTNLYDDRARDGYDIVFAIPFR